MYPDRHSERQMRLRGRLGRGLFTSLFLHGAALAPFVAMTFILADREVAERADETDVSFKPVNPLDLPADLPEVDTRPTLNRLPAPPRKMAERPPTPEPDQPPPPPVPVQAQQEHAHEKIVELDLGKDVAPPPNARFLAGKNNRTDEETRATDTNLLREQKGTRGSSPSDRNDENVGDDKDRTAELSDEKESNPRSEKSLLALREASPRPHAITPETASPSLPSDPDGYRQFRDRDLHSLRDLPVRGKGAAARQARLQMTTKQYEQLFGADDAKQRVARAEQSKRKGKLATRMGQIQSALENFIPEVRPGNQTALNTRAAPFAAFIAHMHRSIHRLWGFGFLEDLGAKPANSPFNDRNLITKLEMVINGDGTMDKVTVIKPSGYLPFDVAAIDTAYSAGPFGEPPRAIRSGNGKIYVHWTFHRDERECGTFGADYFILNNAPEARDKIEESEPLAEPRPARRSHTEPTPEPDPVSAWRAAAQVVRAGDPMARSVAERWFDAYARGDVATMIKYAALPFHSSAGAAAKSAGELGRQLAALVAETSGLRTPHTMQVYSAAGARGVLGSLPAGFGDGAGLLFAVGQVNGGEVFVLVLSTQNGSWRAIGLVRR